MWIAIYRLDIYKRQVQSGHGNFNYFYIYICSKIGYCFCADSGIHLYTEQRFVKVVYILGYTYAGEKFMKIPMVLSLILFVTTLKQWLLATSCRKWLFYGTIRLLLWRTVCGWPISSARYLQKASSVWPWQLQLLLHIVKIVTVLCQPWDPHTHRTMIHESSKNFGSIYELPEKSS